MPTLKICCPRSQLIPFKLYVIYWLCCMAYKLVIADKVVDIVIDRKDGDLDV